MNSLFGNKSSGIQPKKAVIRLERISTAPKPKPLASKVAANKTLSRNNSYEAPIRANIKSSPSDHGSRLQVKKRKAVRQMTPVQRMESDSEDDDTNSTGFEDISIKRHRSDRPVDLKRRLRSKRGFADTNGGVFEMIHAADITAAEIKSKNGVSAGSSRDVVTVRLQYPSASQRERYDLVFGKDQIDPTEEIFKIVEHVTDVYLNSEQAKVFREPNTGIIRQLTKAKNLITNGDKLDKDLLKGFKNVVKVYNSMISKLIDDGALAKNLESKHHLPIEMIITILDQVYERAVSPQVDILTKKRADAQNEKDNTYGELRPLFVSMALEKAGLQSDQVFVDLGSGVGNVVLQAALEFGCESFGCEMVENACKLAKAQEREFAARCRLWGIHAGKVQLEQGSFFENQATFEAIKKADVILVNNEVFSADTNGNLISLFLDCKDGCKIISLQPFVEPGHEITERNLYDPRNQLDVEQHQYHNEYVSWKYDGGDFYISTKDRKRIEAFEKHS